MTRGSVMNASLGELMLQEKDLPRILSGLTGSLFRPRAIRFQLLFGSFGTLAYHLQ
jgi:hypothetical protein